MTLADDETGLENCDEPGEDLADLLDVLAETGEDQLGQAGQARELAEGRLMRNQLLARFAARNRLPLP